MVNEMTIMLTSKGRLYSRVFYRQLKSQAEDAVRIYHERGYYAFKRKVVDSTGCPVWGVYVGGKKHR